ncbi:MAG: ribonuclease J [Euryarchaeota archaeon]|nr:ribonuclease J [Euryarchaeota archaeon]
MPLDLTVYDGARTVGGNKILLDFDGHSVFFDFGINYKRMGEFYEEFLQPRSGRGIHDFLRMELVPRLGIYREDLTPSDLMLPAPKRVEAVLLSHAHMDHAGCIGLLRQDIKVCASPITAALLKAMRDCGRGDIEAEIAYLGARKRAEGEPRVVEAEDRGRTPYRGRDFALTGPLPEGLPAFWSHSPKRRGLVAGALAPAVETFSFRLEAYPVDHSIYGATAFAVETSAGWVVYTGDIRVHGKHAPETEAFVRSAARLRPKVLVMEGTKAGREGNEPTEEEVRRNCLGAVEAEEGLVVADFSPRNFERLETFLRIARETGRRMAVLPKDAYLLDALGLVDGVDRMGELLIYRDLKAHRDGWEAEVLNKFGEKLVDPREVGRRAEEYILAFSFWDLKNLLDIEAKGGRYIYSSSEAYTEDQVIDFQRLHNWLRYMGLEVVGFEVVDGRPRFQKGFHASGHASAEELLAIARAIDPEILVPVHTEDPNFFAEHLPDIGVLIPTRGERVRIG